MLQIRVTWSAGHDFFSLKGYKFDPEGKRRISQGGWMARLRTDEQLKEEEESTQILKELQGEREKRAEMRKNLGQ